MLGLQRAVVLADDHIDQRRHEGLVALDVLGQGEVRGEHEVEVAGRSVAGDTGQEAVLGEQRADLLGGFGDALGPHADVLDDQRGAGQLHLADQPVEALADLPVHLDRLLFAGELGLADQGVAVDDLEGAGFGGGESGFVIGSELDQQGGRCGIDVTEVLGCSDHVPSGGDQGRRDHQLDRRGTGIDQGLDRFGGGRDVGEVEPGQCRHLRQRHGAEGDRGDEGERALGADDQAAEDLHRRVGVEERAEPVADRVLDLELEADALDQILVVEDLLAEFHQTAGEQRLGGREFLLAAFLGGVDDRARRRDEGHRLDRLV